MARTRKKQHRAQKIIATVLLAAIFVVVAWRYFAHYGVAVMQPAGSVASGERRLLIVAFLLMLVIVVPVFMLTFSIAWRYREGGKKGRYTPNWDHSRSLEAVWWLIPSLLIVVLASMTWWGSHEYDPFKPLASSKAPLRIQAVALNWRWLFIYPDQHLASVNYLQFPVNQPVQFEITSDAPMNSLWIPRLGGQMYAMPGMSTSLNLVANKMGSYRGVSANISGEGFANMKFTAAATSTADFKKWIQRSSSMPELTGFAYDNLSINNKDARPYLFSKPMDGLYEHIVDKYMNSHNTSMAMGGEYVW